MTHAIVILNTIRRLQSEQTSILIPESRLIELIITLLVDAQKNKKSFSEIAGSNGYRLKNFFAGLNFCLKEDYIMVSYDKNHTQRFFSVTKKGYGLISAQYQH